MKEEKEINRDLFVNSGRKGGQRTAKRGKRYYEQIGKMGSDKRWASKDETESAEIVDNQDSVKK